MVTGTEKIYQEIIDRTVSRDFSSIFSFFGLDETAEVASVVSLRL
jgi:hypothetical protein